MYASIGRKIWILVIVLNAFIYKVSAQNEVLPVDSSKLPREKIAMFKKGPETDTSYTNIASGELTPGRGFDLVRTKFGSLNISIFGMARYLNQMPGEQVWYDHLGNKREFVGRNDFFWHRAMIWFSGFVGTPKLTYTATVWSVMTTQQTLVYGNIQYALNKHFKFGMGIAPNLCIRTMQGPFPFYFSTDRTMAEECLRGGFTNGFFINGEIVPKLRYTLMVGNNLSTLGVQASKLTRDMSTSASVVWTPTTGEFGPRGGNGDFEYHWKPATRFGASVCHSREDRFNNIGQPSPDNTQVRMSDGVLFFETGALANNVTVDKADYALVSIDAGVKFKGFHFQSEVYLRNLYNFLTDGPVPYKNLRDNGATLQASYMIVPGILMLYGHYSFIKDEFRRNPFELGGGVNIYPIRSRSWRLNLQMMHVKLSASGGTFGLFTSGETGTTLTFGTEILL